MVHSYAVIRSEGAEIPKQRTPMAKPCRSRTECSGRGSLGRCRQDPSALTYLATFQPQHVCPTPSDGGGHVFRAKEWKCFPLFRLFFSSQVS